MVGGAEYTSAVDDDDVDGAAPSLAAASVATAARGVVAAVDGRRRCASRWRLLTGRREGRRVVALRRHVPGVVAGRRRAIRSPSSPISTKASPPCAATRPTPLPRHLDDTAVDEERLAGGGLARDLDLARVGLGVRLRRRHRRRRPAPRSLLEVARHAPPRAAERGLERGGRWAARASRGRRRWGRGRARGCRHRRMRREARAQRADPELDRRARRRARERDRQQTQADRLQAQRRPAEGSARRTRPRDELARVGRRGGERGGEPRRANSESVASAPFGQGAARKQARPRRRQTQRTQPGPSPAARRRRSRRSASAAGAASCSRLVSATCRRCGRIGRAASSAREGTGRAAADKTSTPLPPSPWFFRALPILIGARAQRAEHERCGRTPPTPTRAAEGTTRQPQSARMVRSRRMIYSRSDCWSSRNAYQSPCLLCTGL